MLLSTLELEAGLYDIDKLDLKGKWIDERLGLIEQLLLSNKSDDTILDVIKQAGFKKVQNNQESKAKDKGRAVDSKEVEQENWEEDIEDDENNVDIEDDENDVDIEVVHGVEEIQVVERESWEDDRENIDGIVEDEEDEEDEDVWVVPESWAYEMDDNE